MTLAVVTLEWVDSENDRRLAAASGKFRRKPWVAEIIGVDHRFGLARRFIQGQIDYSRANSKGSRGVFVSFFVEAGRVYQVFGNSGWSGSFREFRWITEDSSRTLREGEILEYLNRTLECYP
jgi:sigma54-dependent transcription regulator